MKEWSCRPGDTGVRLLQACKGWPFARGRRPRAWDMQAAGFGPVQIGGEAGLELLGYWAVGAARLGNSWAKRKMAPIGLAVS